MRTRHLITGIGRITALLAFMVFAWCVSPWMLAWAVAVFFVWAMLHVGKGGANNEHT